jgi:hypothetical protein
MMTMTATTTSCALDLLLLLTTSTLVLVLVLHFVDHRHRMTSTFESETMKAISSSSDVVVQHRRAKRAADGKSDYDEYSSSLSGGDDDTRSAGKCIHSISILILSIRDLFNHRDDLNLFANL